MRTVSEALTAGITKEWMIPPSKFFMLLETVGGVDVELLSVDGRTVELAEGVESGYREKAEFENEKITRVKITSAVAQNIKWGYSARDVDNRKVTSTVAVVDGSVERVKSGIAYSKGLAHGAVVGRWSAVQMFNPSGSGKIAIVNQLGACPYTASGGINLHRYDTEFSTTASYAISKKAGNAADTVIKFRGEDFASSVGTLMQQSRALQDTMVKFLLSEPIILSPGTGICMVGNSANFGVLGNFQYYLEDEQ